MLTLPFAGSLFTFGTENNRTIRCPRLISVAQFKMTTVD